MGLPHTYRELSEKALEWQEVFNKLDGSQTEKPILFGALRPFVDFMVSLNDGLGWRARLHILLYGKLPRNWPRGPN